VPIVSVQLADIVVNDDKDDGLYRPKEIKDSEAIN
jgi:hypothetical protein